MNIICKLFGHKFDDSVFMQFKMDINSTTHCDRCYACLLKQCPFRHPEDERPL